MYRNSTEVNENRHNSMQNKAKVMDMVEKTVGGPLSRKKQLKLNT